MADEQQKQGPHRDFSGRVANGQPPVTFSVEDETFMCLHALPSSALEELAGEEWTVGAMRRFIEGVIVDSDIERFRATIASKDVIISTDELADICLWLIGAISDRPTKSRGGSPRGRKPTARTSRASSSQAARGSKT